MATIRQRRQANGAIRYTAIVRLRKGRVLLHQEYKTFKHLAAAPILGETARGGARKPGDAATQAACRGDPGELVRWYIDSFQSISKWQRSK